jgi:hypothetical protein
MKNLLLLLLFPLALQAQRIVGMGEYQSFILNQTDHQIYTMRTGAQIKVPGQPANIVKVFGGLHVHYAIDVNSVVWAFDENAGTWAQVDTKATKIAPAVNGTGFAAIHTDGSLWVQGLQQKLPAGTFITDVWYPNAVFALDSAGNVYSGNYSGDNTAAVLMQGTNSPVTIGMARVPLPGPAGQIAAHPWAMHAVLRNGQIYAGGQDIRYYGYALFGLNALPVSPVRVDQLYKFPLPVDQISANYMTTFARLSDGSMWGWGENTSGTVGNGQETNMLATSPQYSAPWWNSPAWNQPSTKGGGLFVQYPVQIGAGTKWAELKRGTCFAMYMFAEDVNGGLWSWGRWKGLVLWNGVTGTSAQYNNQANQPNLFDVLVPTPIKDLPNVAPPVNKPPIAVIFFADSTMLSASGPDTLAFNGGLSVDPDGTISSYSWSILSGPAGGAIGGSGLQVVGIFPSAGTYLVQETVTDNSGATNSIARTVTVLPRTCPPVVVCPPPVVCPVCPPIPAPRTVTGVSINAGGQIVPLTQLLPFMLFTYSAN